MQTKLIPPYSEMVSALLAQRCATDKEFMAQMKSRPKEALISHLPQHEQDKAKDLAVRTVQNTPDTVHVCVPCYSMLEDLNVAELDDEQMEKVAGGEIIFSIIFGFTAATIASAVATTVVAAGATAASVAIVVESEAGRL